MMTIFVKINYNSYEIAVPRTGLYIKECPHRLTTINRGSSTLIIPTTISMLFIFMDSRQCVCVLFEDRAEQLVAPQLDKTQTRKYFVD